VTKIAFASCMNAERCPKQPVWNEIAAKEPRALLLLGDHIYMDWGLASLADVPSAKRAWLDQSQKRRDRALQAFAEEMHDRYALQWRIPEFQALVCSIEDRNNILLAWDDHDFAWNSAVGMEGQAWPDDPNGVALNDKAVPGPFKGVAWALSQQFKQVVRTGAKGSSYPGLPNLTVNPPDTIAPEERRIGGVRILLLDQRWARTSRDALAPALLSEYDRGVLSKALEDADDGLLILAGSSPLKHRSITGAHSSWWAEPDTTQPGRLRERAYPEYATLVGGTKRPVLYLGGDIHRNAWGGAVERFEAGSGRQPVIQALSSGAALDHLLFHRYPGSYGIVTIPDAGNGKDGEIAVDLYAVGNPEPENHRLIKLHDGRIDAPIAEGECTDDRLLADADAHFLRLVDQAPMTVLASRSLGPTLLHARAAVSLWPEEVDSQACLDEVPVDIDQNLAQGGANFVTVWPTALVVQADGAKVQFQRVAGEAPNVCAMNAVTAAFERARLAGRSVVLLVHGFGKGMLAALTQAAELRERFECEVVLYTWPTRGGDGLLGALTALTAAKSGAGYVRPGLSAALYTFCVAAKAHPDVPAVLLARSLGALALLELGDALPAADMRAGLRRVLLSAPACTTSKFKDWYDNMGGKVVVTVNTNDRTLGLADHLPIGKLLGLESVRPAGGEVAYLDCTHVSGVGAMHDYLIRRVDVDGPKGHTLAELNEQLVTGKEIDFKNLAVPGLTVHFDGDRFPP